MTNCETFDCSPFPVTIRNCVSLLTIAVLVMVKEGVVLAGRFINFNFVAAFSLIVFIVVSMYVGNWLCSLEKG